MRPLILALSLLLAACAGPIETRVDSAGVMPLQPLTFQIDEAAAADAKPLVIAALEQKGFRYSTNGALLLQLTLADRPAELSLQSGATPLSPAAGKKRCADREYRLGVTLTRIADGAEAYRAYASEFHCKLQMVDVLPALVNAVLADLGAPRGAYVIERPRR